MVVAGDRLSVDKLEEEVVKVAQPVDLYHKVFQYNILAVEQEEVAYQTSKVPFYLV